MPERDADPNGPPSFVVRDGKLVSLGKPEGHLVTDARYRDYRLEVEYRFPGKAGNCGVLIHASTPRALYKMFPQSIEVQMMSGNAGDFWVIREDIKVKDMETRRPARGRREMGLHRGRRPPDPEPHRRLGEAAGEWNSLVIEARGRTHQGLAERRPRERRFRRHGGPGQDRPAGRGRRGRVPQGGDRSAPATQEVAGRPVPACAGLTRTAARVRPRAPVSPGRPRRRSPRPGRTRRTAPP